MSLVFCLCLSCNNSALFWINLLFPLCYWCIQRSHFWYPEDNNYEGLSRWFPLCNTTTPRMIVSSCNMLQHFPFHPKCPILFLSNNQHYFTNLWYSCFCSVDSLLVHQSSDLRTWTSYPCMCSRIFQSSLTLCHTVHIHVHVIQGTSILSPQYMVWEPYPPQPQLLYMLGAGYLDGIQCL